MAKEEKTLGTHPNGLGGLPGARGHLRVAVIVAYSVCPFVIIQWAGGVANCKQAFYARLRAHKSITALGSEQREKK